MNRIATKFTNRLVENLCSHYPDLSRSPDQFQQLIVMKPDGTAVTLDLSPFIGKTYPADAASYFTGIKTTAALLTAYDEIVAATSLENDVPGALDHVDDYAQRKLNTMLKQAAADLTDDEAISISDWLRHLDNYTAIKAFESLLNNRSDRAMLSVADKQGWTPLFDHLAIRCGSEAYNDARRVADFLCQQHGYQAALPEAEIHYRFDDGWDAFPLYKQLDNGLLIRLFIDESSLNHPTQIIQHWNSVYGYTAHHLAIRAIRKKAGAWEAVPLRDMSNALREQAVEVMQPTGDYTHGLLEQVFTRPSQASDLPETILQRLQSINPELPRLIRNGKLIELVSRREMPATLAKAYYALNGISYQADNPLHSAPVYTYFLPAQAAHVIRTSLH